MFYSVFDPFYYSWSPYIAHYLNENSQLKPYMRIMLCPLSASLKTSAIITTPLMQYGSELAVFIAGAMSSILIGIVYIGIPMLILKRKFRRRNVVIALASLSMTIFCSILAEILTWDSLLAFSTVMYVTSFVSIGAYTPLIPLSRVFRVKEYVSEISNYFYSFFLFNMPHKYRFIARTSGSCPLKHRLIDVAIVRTLRENIGSSIVCSCYVLAHA